MGTLARFGVIAVPIALGVGFWLISSPLPDNWRWLKYLALSFAAAVYIATVTRRRLREIAVIFAAVLFGLSAIEAFSVVTGAPPVLIVSEAYSVSVEGLGWGAAHPGVFHETKLDGKTRRVIFDVDYTIDEHRLRRVVSAANGPTVAFFGDSMTFGTGVADAGTLPQLLADAYGRSIRVLNLGFPGYGPQQFLRALETGLLDDLLPESPRLFVYETAAWHAERSSCTSGFMLHAPRYALVGGRPTYEGSCAGRWATMLKQIVANTSFYRMFFAPIASLGRDDIELYIAILARAGVLAREKYGVPTLVLYLHGDDAYLKHAGFTDREIVRCLRAAGLDVIDADLDPARFPGEDLTIPGDGHPTALANRARAALVKGYIDARPPARTAAGAG